MGDGSEFVQGCPRVARYLAYKLHIYKKLLVAEDAGLPIVSPLIPHTPVF